MEETLFDFDENVCHPTHYTDGFGCKDMECITIARHLSFNEGNAFKYVWRAGKKEDNQVQDIEKAMWYIKDLVESDARKGASKVAKCLFDMIIPEESSRYEILKMIVNKEFDQAYDALQDWHDEVKEGSAE